MEEIKQSTTNRNIGKEAVAPDNLSGKDASLYGIFFDDQDDYDYLKHLKPIGEDPSAVFMEVKRAQRNQASGGVIFVVGLKSEVLRRSLHSTCDAEHFLGQEDEAKLDSAKRKVTFNLPAEALPSAYEVDVGMLNQPLAPSMFDVSADVREVLYALEDEEYVDEATGDDFFAALDATRIPNDYSQRDTVSVGPQMEVDEEGWFQQFQRYKVQTASSSDDDDGDGRNESASALNWDSRTMDTSYSAMSSSTMFRSDKLALLDDRFDQILEEYSDDEIGELDADDPSVRGDNLVSKVRLESMLDNFLEATEVVGQKKRLVSRVDKTGLIDSVRDTLKESARDAIKLYENEDDVVEEEGHSAIIMPQEKRPDTWDVESVLTTCSNIYNRPKIIYEGRSELAKIQLKGKSGLPVVEGGKVGLNAKEPVGSSRDVTEEAINKGTARPRSESREEKRRRKQVIKEERRVCPSGTCAQIDSFIMI